MLVYFIGYGPLATNFNNGLNPKNKLKAGKQYRAQNPQNPNVKCCLSTSTMKEIHPQDKNQKGENYFETIIFTN